MKSLHKIYRRTLVATTVIVLIVPLASSCLKEMPETTPDKVIWNPSLAGPLVRDSFGMNLESGFDTSLLNLDTITNLPEWVDEVEVVMEGTVDFDLSELSTSTDFVRRLLLRVNIYNGFPNLVLTQAYFLDPGFNVIDSVFEEGALSIAAGTPIGSGETVEPTHSRRDAVFDQDRIEPLQDATRLLFRATIRNPEVDTSLIPYYPGYFIEADIGAMLDLTYEF
jgi:hypothetical protein